MSGNLVLTNNVVNKLKHKNISQDLIFNAIHYYDKSFPGKQPGTTLFLKETSIGLLNVLAKKIENEKWLVVTFWTKNYQHSNKIVKDARYKNASFWKRVWLDLISTFGL